MIPAAPLALQPSQPSTLQSPRWQQQWRDAVRDPRELLALLGLDAAAAGISAEAAAQFPLRVPRAFVARMRRGDLHDPLLRQVLPLDAEMRLVPGFGLDAVGDGAAKTADGVIQKYRGRALLIATGSCAVHCRYCFRRHFPYAEETAARDGWREAVAAIAADPGIDEVLLSGGDPLSLATSKLAELTDALAAIGHIKRLRIHSRLPVVLPERVDAPLLAWLRSLPWPVAFVIHANHANEFDAEVDAAMHALREAGAQLLNQAVLLRGVNDSVDALAALSERSFAAGVLPYYLHQLDRVAGVAHFEVDDAHARALHTELATRLSGYLVPRLVREIPGDTGKRPL
ncbi:EF-P beta-lysylation protein EpmB [Xanthomonas hortorum]|uniref:L-lysine 2,3-aminomutase n=1 Tax=Xanthomonas hortorum pv. hederae TaxID=453603 RepID=A0A9X4BR93_9XANT|nr:EF-P beta-lysylation protein EpmB [Xanthomonas hortorum]MCE4370473.1 EF-P beta-lysylation protein EpmB [Xanthomonas hortorum pv. hederae]MDC8638115.1 EF-P beta-lysylation protein EpmB [Xanthomonas hortorum pv. hederae]PPU84033.1 EF-P beta-lysylation protein EpmB [Xanthomonas hortorum pv. hederae]PUF01015.1 EF-P beta-lysylation protein EpmB [Xanthomonas hortorum pv. hederae]